MERAATVVRQTKETNIELTLGLDGGEVVVDTGVGFFDHMLTALAVHGGFGLQLKAEGDWNVDCHHTVEDTGIVLGRAFKQALGDRVEGVRVSSRLVDSPSCLVADADKRLTPQMRRMLEAAGQQVPEDKVTLEINPSHPLLKKAEAEKDQAGFEKWCELMLDQAALADQGTVKDPARFVKLMNELLLK